MKRLIFLLNIFIVLSLVSCARAPIRHEPYIPESIITAPEVLRGDIIHEVAPGETVWRISKMYDVEEIDIIRANKLRDAGKLEKGQKLFIPKAAPIQAVIALEPSEKWRYIIIHHSATDEGNALRFDYHHIKDRKWKSLGYHFVIDNGTSGKQDGQIEVSPRWLRQEDGAHCKAGNMNSKSIGICLVGNFNEDTLTFKQMNSLVFLVNRLKEYYDISNSHILGHGQVKGASTDCPGKKFPWAEFKARLNP